ncbi:WxPxxD family membrane protein [Terribacillus saccharophilus]|uniref:WxPxxD family membrane protein n=1 Tax=Terribacillus saccharophilus TaxID=361277 RepID=UPI00384FA3D7
MFYICFFIIVWYLQGIPVIWNPSLDSLLLLNSSASGYNSITAYALLYSIPFLLLTYHFYLPNNIITYTRYKSRESNYIRIFMQTLLVAVLFSTLHFLVNLILTSIHFDWNIIQESNFIFIGIINSISLCLFFLFIGLLNQIIKIFVGKYVVSIFISFVILGSYFFLDKLILQGSTWSILKELGIMTYYFYDNWTIAEILFSIIRLLAVVCVTYIIGSIFYLKRDVISYDA